MRTMITRLDPRTARRRPSALNIGRLSAKCNTGHSGTVMPGAADLLKSIPEGRWCVVTSGTRYLATSRLRFAQLPIPRVLVAADDVQKGKPDPEPYLKGARLLKVKPTECLVIEDAPAGIRSAHAGGMKAIALASTYLPAELDEADAVLQNLGQIQIRGVDAERRLQVEIF